MAGDFQVAWRDFKGGDAGVRDPSLWDRDQWRGVNLVVYRSGLLGPRAGLDQVIVTDLPDHSYAGSPAGLAVFKDSIFVVLDKLYKIPLNGGAAVSAPVYNPVPAANTRARFVAGNGELYVLLYRQGVFSDLYRHGNSGVAVTTAITIPTDFRMIAAWGPWLVAVPPSGGTEAHRIYFNQVDAAGADYTSWPANNFYDVAESTDEITDLSPVFNTLYVGKRIGWFAVTGVLGDLASIREVAIGSGPDSDLRSAVGVDSRVWYWAADESPVVFDGARAPTVVDEQYDQARNFEAAGDLVVATPTGNKVLMTAGTYPDFTGHEVLMRDGQGWARLAFPLVIGGWAPATAKGAWLQGGAVWVVNQASSGPVTIASWRYDLNRPAHHDDDKAEPDDLGSGSLVTGTVSLPAYWEPQGRQVRVRRVIVQFRKWSSGLAGSVNRLRFRVDALGQFGDGPEAGTAQEWSEQSAAASDDGVDESVRFDFGSQGFGNGFQVVFEAVAGVAIREVVAEVELLRDR